MRLAVLGPFGLMHDRILHHRQWWFHEDACDITAGCEALPPVQGLTSIFGCKSQSCCCGWLDLTPLQAGFVLGLLQHVIGGGGWGFAPRSGCLRTNTIRSHIRIHLMPDWVRLDLPFWLLHCPTLLEPVSCPHPLFLLLLLPLLLLSALCLQGTLCLLACCSAALLPDVLTIWSDKSITKVDDECDWWCLPVEFNILSR